jgi:hypothetical protein
LNFYFQFIFLILFRSIVELSGYSLLPKRINIGETMNGNCFCNLLPRFLLSGTFIFSLVFGGFSSEVRAEDSGYQIYKGADFKSLGSTNPNVPNTTPTLTAPFSASEITNESQTGFPAEYKDLAPSSTESGASAMESGSAAAAGGEMTVQDARKYAAETGLTEGAGQIAKAAGDIQNASVLVPAGAIIPGKEKIAMLLSEAKSYQSHYGKCVMTQNAAATLCRERTSPHLQEGMMVVNGLAAGLTGLAVKDSCSTISKIMQAGQGALALYTAACSATRASCEASCSFVMGSLKTIEKLSQDISLSICVAAPSPKVDPAVAVACSKFTNTVKGLLNKINSLAIKDNSLDESRSTAMKNKACTYDYLSMLASAGAGIMSLANTLSQSSNCDKKTDGTGGQPTALAANKCKYPEFKNTPECICLASPRTPGCANSLDKAGQNVNPGYVNQSTPDSNLGLNKKDLTNLDLGGGNAARDPANANPNSDSGGNGTPVGGGGSAGLGGSGGGAGGGSDKAGADGEKKGLNANIFGGGSGGGGGGGWGRDFGGGADKSGLRSYLPGGAKDPLKMSGQQNWNKEVTGQAGKSNFEKVRDRYRDNNGSLLNN